MQNHKKAERLAELRMDLRSGQRVTDFRFDDVFPNSARDLSKTHWSPFEVSVRAASFLATGPKTRILDVGSGCGKFCLIGALTTNAIYVGIEQRPALLKIARAARDTLQGSRVFFIQGNMVDLDWTCFDAFYLFNPFHEHQVDTLRMDQTLNYREETYREYIRVVEQKLAGLKTGTRVVAYHGFGGSFPPGYRHLHSESAGTGVLELWEKCAQVPVRIGETEPIEAVQ